MNVYGEQKSESRVASVFIPTIRFKERSLCTHDAYAVPMPNACSAEDDWKANQYGDFKLSR